MRQKIQQLIGLILTLIIISCSINTQKISDNDSGKPLSKADTLWINIKEALLTNQIDYLIENSFDTIQCVDCYNDSLKSQNENYSSRFIFTNNLKSLIHTDIWNKYGYTASKTDSMIYINYSIKSKSSEKGGENLIYMFKKKGHRFLFIGKITVP